MPEDAPPPGQPLSGRAELERLTTALRAEHGAFYDWLEALLYRHDPVRIDSPHADEYSPEVRDLLPRLAGCTSATEVAQLTYDVFVRFFSVGSVGPRSRYDIIGEEIWAELASAASRSGRSTPPSP